MSYSFFYAIGNYIRLHKKCSAKVILNCKRLHEVRNVFTKIKGNKKEKTQYKQ